MEKNNKKNRQDGENWCMRFGLRKTKTRETLFAVLSKASGPQSVPQILASFKKQKYTPNKTTVYREIEALLKRGIITKVQLAESRVSYELSGDHHHHFVCQECETVTKLSFCEPTLSAVERALAKEGKMVTHHTFEFFGICKECK